MVTLMSGAQAASAPTDLIFNKTTPAAPADSFAQQLISELQRYLNHSANGSHLQIDIQSEPSQNSGDRQFLVTVKDATSAPVAPPVAAPVVAASAQPTLDKSHMTPTDAYWAEQPPELQALRYMPEDQKGDAVQELSAKGFAVDVPIMLWGWDPLVVMTARQTAGYTWVPSAMQTAIAVGPGLNFPGLPSYDPKNPPAGAIKVSTDFAIGTNNQDPWIKV